MSESSDKLIDLATTQLTNVIETVKTTTPKITETVLMITSYARLATIVGYVTCLILSVISLGIARYSYVRWSLIVEEKGQAWIDDYHISWAIVCAASLILGIILFLVSFISLLDFWTWLGVWHPDLYLAHELVEKLTSSERH